MLLVGLLAEPNEVDYWPVPGTQKKRLVSFPHLRVPSAFLLVSRTHHAPIYNSVNRFTNSGMSTWNRDHD